MLTGFERIAAILNAAIRFFVLNIKSYYDVKMQHDMIFVIMSSLCTTIDLRDRKEV